jgi:glycosyltransferase involved in cell wall biosynthesis
MENNNTISVILPIKSSKVLDFEDYFKKCITSIKNQIEHVNELVIVHTDETSLVEFLNNYDFEGINVNKVLWTESPNFCSQINYGVEQSTSTWVSFLEFDDEYSNIWFKNAKNYMGYYKDFGAFLPIVVDVNDKGVFAGFTNEATFAANISQELGILTNETLLNYQNFQLSGLLIKRDDFINVGKLKTNIKLTFGYEFFLRLTNNHVKVMTVPRIGYKHMNLRQGSIFWNYKNGDDRLSEDEVKFWVDSAKKEYFFDAEREIKYEPQEV